MKKLENLFSDKIFQLFRNHAVDSTFRVLNYVTVYNGKHKKFQVASTFGKYNKIPRPLKNLIIGRKKHKSTKL